MNTIAWLGRLVIERIRGIGVAALMLLQIIFHYLQRAVLDVLSIKCIVGVMSLLIITVSGLFIGLVLDCKATQY